MITRSKKDQFVPIFNLTSGAGAGGGRPGHRRLREGTVQPGRNYGHRGRRYDTVTWFRERPELFRSKAGLPSASAALETGVALRRSYRTVGRHPSGRRDILFFRKLPVRSSYESPRWKHRPRIYCAGALDNLRSSVIRSPENNVSPSVSSVRRAVQSPRSGRFFASRRIWRACPGEECLPRGRERGLVDSAQDGQLPFPR